MLSRISQDLVPQGTFRTLLGGTQHCGTPQNTAAADAAAPPSPTCAGGKEPGGTHAAGGGHGGGAQSAAAGICRVAAPGRGGAKLAGGDLRAGDCRIPNSTPLSRSSLLAEPCASSNLTAYIYILKAALKGSGHLFILQVHCSALVACLPCATRAKQLHCAVMHWQPMLVASRQLSGGHLLGPACINCSLGWHHQSGSSRKGTQHRYGAGRHQPYWRWQRSLGRCSREGRRQHISLITTTMASMACRMLPATACCPWPHAHWVCRPRQRT